MNTHYLHRDAFFCLVEEGTIFLNADSGEYLAVDSARFAVISKSLSGWPAERLANEQASLAAERSGQLLAELVRRGILTISAVEGKPAEPVALASRRALPSTSYGQNLHRPPFADAASLLFALIHTVVGLRRRNLLGLLRRIEAAKISAPPNAPIRCARGIGHLMTSFDKLRVWCYSAEGACLKDSLVLADFLLRRGGLPTFVIGVRSRPFAAHAWVQDGDVVLNDTLENIQRYTPILAV